MTAGPAYACGCKVYSPPEVLAAWAGDLTPIDPYKHDVFSVGVLIFEVRVHPSAQPQQVVCLCLNIWASLQRMQLSYTTLHQQAQGLALSAALLCRAGSQACQLRPCSAVWPV